MAQSVLSLLIRRDMAFRADAVEVFLRLLVHDSIKSRKMAASFFGPYLKIGKRAAKKVSAVEWMRDSGKGDADALRVDAGTPRFGFREDNRWMTLSEEQVPKTECAWNATPFVDKTHWGICAWPRSADAARNRSLRSSWMKF